MRKSSLPLILTNEQANVRLPEGLILQPETAFRMVEVIGGAFFVALVASDSFEDQQPRTLIVSWDSDLLGFIESPKMAARLLQLDHFTASQEDGQVHLRHRQVLSICRGVDTAAGDTEVILFLAADGTRFCGPEAIAPPPSVKVGPLVTNIGDPSRAEIRQGRPPGRSI